MVIPATAVSQLRVGDAGPLFEPAGAARRSGRWRGVPADVARLVRIEPAGVPPGPFAWVVQNRFAAFPKGKARREQ